MHRLFVLGPLKTQRNFQLPDSSDLQAKDVGGTACAAAHPAAFMLQKSVDSLIEVRVPHLKASYFRYL
jgi:hypothetical protein